MRKQTFIPGGIYTDYKNDLAIFTGIYSDSHEEDKNTFILLEDCQYRTHEEIVNYIKRIGIGSIMSYIQMLHLKMIIMHMAISDKCQEICGKKWILI